MKKLQHPQIIPRSSLNTLILNEEIDRNLKKVRIKNRPEIVFFGSDDFVIQILKALEDEFEVKCVVTAHDSAVSRYFKGPMLTPDRLDENFLTSNLQLLTSDLFVVASYGRIIPKDILDIAKYGALNVHPSLLPKYRGPSPIQAAILNGDEVSGITIIKMDEKMDHGPIIYTKEIRLSQKDTFETLSTKMFLRASEILPKIIEDFVAGKITPTPQDESKATFCKLLTKEDGYFDINNPPSPEILDRMIRTYYPWPNCWTNWKGKIVKFLPNQMMQMEGKKIIPLKDFLNGYPDFPIKKF